MRLWLFLILLAGWVVLFPIPVTAQSFQQDRQRCGSRSAPLDVIIGACTRQLQSGRYDDKALAIGYTNRGLAYGKKGQFDRAIQDYDQALRLNPRHPNAYVNRGVSYERKGQHDRALQDYKRANAMGNRSSWLLKKLRSLGVVVK